MNSNNLSTVSGSARNQSSLSAPDRHHSDVHRNYSSLHDWDLARSQFTFLEVLGRGQFSTVYKGFDKRHQRAVALKVVCLRTIQEEKTRSDCIKEVRFLQNLQHPNIIQLFSAFSSNSDSEMVLVLELADQGDLTSVISACRQRGGYLTHAQVWCYLTQILAAVQYVHGKRILHRDIKPSNIFLSSQDRVKLGDLGFSRFLSPKTFSVDSFLGTPYYMSPERLRELKYSFPSDVWSLGCVLYEMVALQSPFFSQHISLNGLCKRIEMGMYPPVPNADMYSSSVQKIITSCLTPNPDLRPNIETLIQWTGDQRPTSGSDQWTGDQRLTSGAD